MSARAHWKTSRPAPEGTHHLKTADGRALYRTRYDAVLPFHAPGLAPARLDGEAFHILPNGRCAYPQRFTQTFGFYDRLAAVTAGRDWFHIHPDGRAAYQQTWSWCGNFQQGRCSVRDGRGRYHHIGGDGVLLAGGPYCYAGDFREGAAVVRTMDGLCGHINLQGEPLHDQTFFDLDVFHKGLARARDADGWFHLARDGSDASSGRRYRSLEPFYNGQALAKMHDGEIAVIDEQGEIQVAVNRSEAEYRAELHEISVSLWRPLAMRLGVLLGLAGGESAITCPPQHLDIVKRAWVGLGLLDDKGQLTALGTRLAPGMVERDRLLYWTGPQFTPWVEAEKRIQRTAERNFFATHANNTETIDLIQRALDSYATADWAGIAEILCLPDGATVVDVGGGKGAMLEELSAHRGRKILVDLPGTVPDDSCNGVEFTGLDFFERPLPKGDVYLFSRVLHDWPDKKAAKILARIPAGVTVIVIDREDHAGRHGLLGLNMLLINGSWERTHEEWKTLFKASRFILQKRGAWNGHSVMWLTKQK